jgi:hypothetical protein
MPLQISPLNLHFWRPSTLPSKMWAPPIFRPPPFRISPLCPASSRAASVRRVLAKKGKLGSATAENRVLQWLADTEDVRSGNRRDKGAPWPMCLPLPIPELQLLRLRRWKRWSSTVAQSRLWRISWMRGPDGTRRALERCRPYVRANAGPRAQGAAAVAMSVRRHRSQQRGRRRKGGATGPCQWWDDLSEQSNLWRTTARVSCGRETAVAASFSPPVPATPGGWSSRRRAPGWAPLGCLHGLSSHVDKPPRVVVRGRRRGRRGCARRRAAGAAARVVLRQRVDSTGGLVYTTSIAGTNMVAGSRADPQLTNPLQGHNPIQSSPISNPEQQKHSTLCLLPAPRPRRPNQPTIAASRPANQLEAATSGAGVSNWTCRSRIQRRSTVLGRLLWRGLRR